ncbi:hypothetical protein CC78DRAFT_579611 [Lojkania enalia]|uniref:RING-type domain-containing protein n=1 Tax=Lojkania enalia TaxID=147567 RepID=A0A9P4KFL3_9PLEO|nr:hypothetical protein CC78DRAFT_579611 [Didymosphaeria enalia]
MPLPSKVQFVNSLKVPGEPCPICWGCFDATQHIAVRTGCGHWFGSNCLLKSIKLAPDPTKCPTCRKKMFLDEIEEEETAEAPYITPRTPISASSISSTEYTRIWKDILYFQNEVFGVSFVQMLWEGARPFAHFVMAGRNTRERFYSIYPQLTLCLSSEASKRDSAWNPVKRYLNAAMEFQGSSVEWIFFDFREVLRFMLTHSFLLFPGSLCFETSNLLWRAIVVYSSHMNERPIPNEWNVMLIGMHLVIVAESMALITEPHRAWEQVYPESGGIWRLAALCSTIPGGSRALHFDTHMRREVILELERLYSTRRDLNRPLFIGAFEEECEIQSIWDRARNAVENRAL